MEGRMAGPQPIAISVSAPQQAVLERLLRQHSCPQALALRVRIVLGAASGIRNEPLATRLSCSPTTVRKWRARWADAARPGTPDTFSAEQIVQIVNLACTSPRACGRPIDAWTPRELADEAERQGIVISISATTVGRFLGRSRSPAASESLLAQRQGQGS